MMNKKYNLSIEESQSDEKFAGKLASRLALSNAVKHYDYQIPSEEINLINYKTIEGAESLTCSVSHTKNIGAALIGEQSKYKSMGLDIELKSRKIKSEADKFFINENDKFPPTTTKLQKWCIKEACYKACSNALGKTSMLKYINVDAHRFTFESIIGQYEIIEDENLVIVVAFVNV